MKFYRKLKPIMAISLSIFFICFIFIIATGIINTIPSEYNIQLGDEYSLQTRFPFSFSQDYMGNVLEIDESDTITDAVLTNIFKVKTHEKGTADLQVKILGLIPYKTVKVNVVNKIEVIPGGESVGVKLNTDGVLVVGISEITDENGKTFNLASSSGIKIGDTLIEINGIKVNNASHVIDIVKSSQGKEIALTMKRDNNKFTATVSPVKAEQDGQYRLGLWVRDKTAGVGTLSFVHPDSGKFGALGHAITDVDTGALLSVKDGEVIRSRVVSIEQGKRGKPGEIRGVFYETNSPIGIIEKNTQLGVYGEIVPTISEINKKKAMPIAYQHEIQEGPAYILTTLDNNQIDKFDIEITKINPQAKPEAKSMVIKVTDERLLEKTGGIVQGMSGSPIIQNDKVVGAVTHVLVNDPTRGYGIFIEWMISESGINYTNR